MVGIQGCPCFQEAGVPAGAITGILHYREKVKRKTAIGEDIMSHHIAGPILQEKESVCILVLVTDSLERAPNPLISRLVRCSAHGHSFVRLRYLF